jgi:Cu+-exporting ATPase
MPTKLKKKGIREKDPVCDMEVEVRDALTETLDGKTYVFCSEECRQKFQDSPSDYV